MYAYLSISLVKIKIYSFALCHFSSIKFEEKMILKILEYIKKLAITWCNISMGINMCVRKKYVVFQKQSFGGEIFKENVVSKKFLIITKYI